MISAAQFLTLIRNRAGEPDRATYQDPLGAARAFIADRPDTAEARALAKVVEMIRTGEGEFGDSDIYLLGSQALVIADALAEAAMKGLIRIER